MPSKSSHLGEGMIGSELPKPGIDIDGFTAFWFWRQGYMTSTSVDSEKQKRAFNCRLLLYFQECFETNL